MLVMKVEKSMTNLYVFLGDTLKKAKQQLHQQVKKKHE